MRLYKNESEGFGLDLPFEFFLQSLKIAGDVVVFHGHRKGPSPSFVVFLKIGARIISDGLASETEDLGCNFYILIRR